MKAFSHIFRTSILICLFSTLSVVTLNAQVTLKLGGGLGVMSAVSDMNGSTLDYYAGDKLGFNSGLNVHGRAKVGLVGFTLVGGLEYSTLTSSGNSEPGQGKVDLTQNILTLKAGPEFSIAIPASPITPYVGANIALNSFSGETKFQGISKVPSATYIVETVSRIGAGFTVGAEVSIGPLMSLDFAATYNLMNMSGAEWNDVNPSADQRLDSYLSLNDAKDPAYAVGSDKHFIDQDRSIHSMMFTVTFLVGL